MKLRLNLLTPALELVCPPIDVTLVAPVDVVTFHGGRYLRDRERAGGDDADGALSFDFVEETTYAAS